MLILKHKIKYLLCLALIMFIWQEPIIEMLTPLGESYPLKLYASQCDNDLRKTYLREIKNAKKAIFLVIYSLSDKKIISALNEKAAVNVEITIVIHHSAMSKQAIKTLHPNISLTIRKLSGLMHQKILIVDHERILLGSANLTTESLLFHDNLVIGIWSEHLAKRIMHVNDTSQVCHIGHHLIEFWSLPEEKNKALERLIELVDQAEISVCLAMYTLTHPDLINAVLRAHARNVKIEVILDYKSLNGVSRKAAEILLKDNVSVFVQAESSTLHHKFAWIDEKLLINGSTNWTRAAFTKNADCFLVIDGLDGKQRKKMHKLWHHIRCTAKPLE